MKEIVCTEKIDYVSVSKIIADIENTLEEDCFCINFKTTSFALPTGLLILSQYLKYCLFNKCLHISIVPPQKNSVSNYFDVIGFLKFIQTKDLTWKKVDKNKTYIPLSVIDLYEMKKNQDEMGFSCMQEYVKDYVGNYIECIFGYRDEVVIYCFSEIVRNVHEHSGAKYCSIFGQRYKNNNTLELCVADSGHGVFDSLSKKVCVQDTEDALKKALLPGVSAGSVCGEGANANTGFGLYVLSELAKRHGFMIIGSIDTYLRIEASGISSEKCCFPGTFIGFHVSLDNFLNNEQEIRDIISEGERLQKQANYGK